MKITSDLKAADRVARSDFSKRIDDEHASTFAADMARALRNVPSTDTDKRKAQRSLAKRIAKVTTRELDQSDDEHVLLEALEYVIDSVIPQLDDLDTSAKAYMTALLKDEMAIREECFTQRQAAVGQ
ncbi:hypothetical protein [Carnimonas bestiolae]|uniref:hypothetical protein n=1 Tax=Carnimonas bestiolae TaxID=3402172 RepID=UPI003EDC4F90